MPNPTLADTFSLFDKIKRKDRRRKRRKAKKSAADRLVSKLVPADSPNVVPLEAMPEEMQAELQGLIDGPAGFDVTALEKDERSLLGHIMSTSTSTAVGGGPGSMKPGLSKPIVESIRTAVMRIGKEAGRPEFAQRVATKAGDFARSGVGVIKNRMSGPILDVARRAGVRAIPRMAGRALGKAAGPVGTAAGIMLDSAPTVSSNTEYEGLARHRARMLAENPEMRIGRVALGDGYQVGPVQGQTVSVGPVTIEDEEDRRRRLLLASR